MEVITNNVPRDVIEGYQLSEKERAEFDYMDCNWYGHFIRYKGELIDLDDFERWSNPSSPLTKEWDGFKSDTFFSGVLIRYVPDTDLEQVIVGRYYC